MRITIVQGAFFPVPPIRGGAVEKVWFSLGKEFARRGHQVTHISRALANLPTRENIAGVQHVRVAGFDQPRSGLRLKLLDFIYSLGARRVLPAADILITNTFWLPLLVRNADRGLLCVNVQRMPKGQMRWYSHVARLLAVSRSIADAIIAEQHSLADKVRVLPNCLPFEVPAQINLSRRNKILYVGRIHPEKGLAPFLRALALLPEWLVRDWELEIVGPHEIAAGGGGVAFLDELKELARPLALRVAWSGSIFDERELIARYQRAAIFVYPSLAETGESFGLAPLEAMANGCIPLVSKLACFDDFIDDGVNGFVFDHRADDPARALAERLRTLLTISLSDREKLAVAAHGRAQEFAAPVVAERYIEDFASLLAAERM